MFRCPGSKQQIVVQINQLINPFLTGTVVITSQVSSAQLSSSPPGTGTAEPVPKKTTRSMRAMRFCDFPAAAPDNDYMTTCQTPRASGNGMKWWMMLFPCTRMK